MTPEEFRKHGHAVVDWIADYRTRVEQLPVMAQTAPGDTVASRRRRLRESAGLHQSGVRDSAA